MEEKIKCPYCPNRSKTKDLIFNPEYMTKSQRMLLGQKYTYECPKCYKTVRVTKED